MQETDGTHIRINDGTGHQGGEFGHWLPLSCLKCGRGRLIDRELPGGKETRNMKPTRPLNVRAWVERTCDSPGCGVAEFTGQARCRRECRLCCEQKLQVHKVREGSAVGSDGEPPWGRTLMCARFKAAVEAAARQCGVYRRLPRDRLLESTLGAGRGTLHFDVR